MKKTQALFAFSGLILSIVAFGQNDKQLSSQKLISKEKKEIHLNVQDRPTIVEQQFKLPIVCDSLTAMTSAGNNYHGNMFDILVDSVCTLETFSVSVDAGTWNIAIFYKTGTFVGFDTTASAWTFLDSANVVSTTTGAGTLYKIPVNLNLALSLGTHAFYITGTKPTITFNYTNGTSVGTVVSSDSYLTIFEGNGGGYPFDVTYSTRVFNGRAYYCAVVPSGIEDNTLASFDMFPNPANQSVSLDLTAFNGNDVTVSVLNTLGQRLQSTAVVANGTQTLNIEGYAAGMYFVQVEMNGKTSTSKLSIK